MEVELELDVSVAVEDVEDMVNSICWAPRCLDYRMNWETVGSGRNVRDVGLMRID